MKSITYINYLIILAVYLVDARTKRSVDQPVLKYYLDGSHLEMECEPPSGVDCKWSVNTGNTFFIQSLPPSVKRNSSDSCTINFSRPAIYHSQIWTCELKDSFGQPPGVIISTYKILEGARPTAPIFKSDGGFLSLRDSVDWAKKIEANCSTVIEGIPPPVYNINVTGVNMKKVGNNSVLLEPNLTDAEAKLTCTIEQPFLRNPLSTTITLQLEDKPKILGEPISSYDDNMKKQILKYNFISMPRLTDYEWSFSNSSNINVTKASVDKEERYDSLKIFDEELGQSLTLVITDFNDLDEKRYFYLKLTNAKGFIELGPLSAAGSMIQHTYIIICIMFFPTMKYISA